MARRFAAGLLLAVVAFSGNRASARPDEPSESLPGNARRVFVPLDELDAVVEPDREGVILSRSEFVKLARLAEEQSAGIPPAARRAVVSKAEYAAEAIGDSLTLVANVEFTQLRPGWQTIRLPYRNLSVEQATLDGEPAQIGRDGPDRALIVFSSKPGQHTLSLKLSAGLASVGSDRIAAFGLAPVPAATLRITLPAGQYLQVDDLPLERPADADQPAGYAVSVGGRSELTLRLTGREARQQSGTLVFAGTAIGLHVAPEERTWRGVTLLNVFGNPIDAARFIVPRSLEIVSVESSGLERWEISGGPGDRFSVLKLVYRQPFAESRTVTIQGVSSSVIGQPWSVPTLGLEGATSHLARVVVRHPASLRLQLLESSGARRIGADEAAAGDMPSGADPNVGTAAANTLHFATWQDDFTLLFVTEPRARELQATIATRVDIDSRELGLRSSIAVRTRFAPLFDVEFSLPVDWSVSQVLVGEQPAAWRVVPVEAGRNLVQVAFASPIAAESKVDLTLVARRIPSEHWPVEDEPLQMPLPEVALSQVGVTDGRYMIAAEDDLDLSIEELSGLDPVRLSPAEERLARAPRLAYEYQDSRFQGTLRVARKPLRLSAQTLAFHRLDRDKLSSHLEARVVAQGGGLRKIDVALPEASGLDLRFQLIEQPGRSAAQLIEQSAAAPANGERLWTLRFDRRVFGLLWLAVDLQRARDPQSTDVALPALRVVGADRQSGQLAIEAGPDQQLNVTALDAVGRPLAEVDPADVPAPTGYLPKERIVAAYQAVHPGYRIVVAETRFARQAVPTAICDLSRLQTVAGTAGESQHDADFQFRAVGVQSLRLELPNNARLWSTLIDGSPIEVRVDPTAGDGVARFLVPLPPGLGAAAPRRLQLFYRTTGDELHSAGTLSHAPPAIEVVSGDGQSQPLEILEREWTLHYPDRVVLTASGGAFEPVDKLDRPSVLGRLQRMMVPMSPDDLAGKLAAIAVAVGLSGVLWLAGRRRGTKGVLTAALIGGVLIALGFLLLPGEKQGYLARMDAAKPEAPAGATLPSAYYRRDDLPFKNHILAFPTGDSESSELSARKDVEPEDRGRQPGIDSRLPVHAREMPQNFGAPVPVQRGGQVVNALPPDMAQQPMPAHGGAPIPPAPDAAPGANPVAAKIARQAAGAGALLSLAVQLQPGPDSRATKFQYSGAPATGDPPLLAVDYQNRQALALSTLAWQAATLLLFWFSRRSSAGVRATLAVLGLVVPLALTPIVPLEALPHLDGIFLGTLWGIVLWAALALLHGAPHAWSAIRWERQAAKAPGMLLLGLGLLVWASRTITAEDAPAPAAISTAGSGLKTIIVPYDDPARPWEADRVYLPFDKFLDLWNAAHPDDSVPLDRPGDGIVAEALFSAAFQPAAAGGKASAQVKARFVLHSFQSEAITLALPLEPVAVSSAILDGQPAPLVTNAFDAGNQLAIVLSKGGPHVLDLQFAVAAEQAGPVGRFTLPLKPVAAGTLRFKLPGADQSLKVAGGAGHFRRVVDGEGAFALIPIDRGGLVTLEWSPARSREAADGIVHVESSTALRFDDAGLRMRARFQFAVRQGTFGEAVFDLPAGLVVRQISGLDLGGWEILSEGDRRSLKVFLRRAVADATTLDFDLFQPLAIAEQPQPVAIPQFAPRNVTRETGTLGLYGERQLTLTTDDASGIAQIEPGQFSMPQTGLGAPLLAYRFSMRPFPLRVLVARQKPTSKCVAEHACFLGNRKQRLVSRLSVQLVGAPRSELSFQLPPGYLLYDLTCRDAADHHVLPAGEGESPILTIDLATPRTGEIEVFLDGAVPRPPDDLQPMLLVPAPLGVGDLRSSLALWLEPGISATFDELDGWKSIDPEQLSARLKRARGGSVQMAFTSNLTAVQPIFLTLQRTASKLAADALTVVLARATSMQYSLYLRWRISLAGEDTFVFTTPDWLANRLDIERRQPGIRIRNVSTETVAGNRLRWTVTLEEPREGALLLTAEAAFPPPENGRIAAPQIGFERALTDEAGRRYVALESQQQHLVLVNQSPTRLDRDSGADAVDSIAAHDLPVKIDSKISDEAAEILAVRDSRADIGWKAQSAEALKALPAAVNLARLTHVLSRDGSWRAEAAYRVSNRSRQFLAIRLPTKSRVLSLFVDDQPARPIDPGRPADPDVLLVPLPKTATGDLSASIRLVFAGRLDRQLPRGVQILRTQLDLPAPEVLPSKDDPEFGAPVAATEWTVVLPEDLNVRPVDDPARTNVFAASAGAESLIAEYQEWLRLAALASDRTLDEGAQLRCENNLKQLNVALQRQSVSQGVSIVDDRQNRQLQELHSQWEAANRELSSLLAPGPERPAVSSRRSKFSSQELKQRILAVNSGVDLSLDNSGSMEKGVNELDLVQERGRPAGRDAQPQGEKDSAPSAKGRTTLRSETARQSAELNSSQAIQALAPQSGKPAAGGPPEDAAGVEERPSEERYRKTPITYPVEGEIDADQLAQFQHDQSTDEAVPFAGVPITDKRSTAHRGAAGVANGRPAPAGPMTGGGGLGGLGGQQRQQLAFAAEGMSRVESAGYAPLASEWSQAGGLSLDIALAPAGQRLTFSKSGGDARLALGLRPRASTDALLGLGWTVVWIVAGLGLIAVLGQPHALSRLRRRLPLDMILVGGVWFLALPGASLGFVVLALGLVTLAWQYRLQA